MWSGHSQQPLAVTGPGALQGTPELPQLRAPAGTPGPAPHSPPGYPGQRGLCPTVLGLLCPWGVPSAPQNSPAQVHPEEGNPGHGGHDGLGAAPGPVGAPEGSARDGPEARPVPVPGGSGRPRTGTAGAPGSGAITARARRAESPEPPSRAEPRGSRARSRPRAGQRGRPGREGLRAAGAPPARRPGLSGSRDLCGGFTGKVAAGGGGAPAASPAGDGAPAGSPRPPGSGSGPRGPTEPPRAARAPHRARPRQPRHRVRWGSVPGRSSGTAQPGTCPRTPGVWRGPGPGCPTRPG